MGAFAARVFPNSYRDSVELMQIAAEIEGLEGVTRAGLVMATPANRDVLAAAGLLVEVATGAGPNDLVVAVAAEDDAVATLAVERAAAALAGDRDNEPGGSAVVSAARTIAEAVTELGGANLALISTPGPYATAEALKALKRGLHVFLFSDNVPIEDEVELKALARHKGLLVMGPDCGTAMLDGIPLGFANAVRRGAIGLVAASGTGLQEVSCLVHRAGAGISQAIGVGGRDLDERVGGAMMLEAIGRLAADEATQAIVLISKPPAPAVADRVLQAAAGAGKPVVANFLGGDPVRIAAAGAVPAVTFEAAAAAAVALAAGRSPAPDPGLAAGLEPALATQADAAAARLGPGRTRVRGLYSGGSLAGEAKLILAAALGKERAAAHEVLDLGDDAYTVGRPHPMIDARLRTELIREAVADPATAVVLLDVVLGHGASPDPAGPLADALADRGDIVAVASVCGTDDDPQGRAGEEALLARAGVLLAPSNAQAARVAARIAARLTPTTTATPAARTP